jgi:multidrug resistance protein
MTPQDSPPLNTSAIASELENAEHDVKTLTLDAEKAETCNPAPSATSEHAVAPDGPNGLVTAYTTFTRPQLRFLTLLLGLATITSPLTATIYFPLLPLLRTHFSVSAQAINLTLTIYIIFQALSPAVFGPLSDTLGRRHVYLLTLAIYCAGNLGLALNSSSYPALLVLRALQSIGASAAYAVSYGVVADVCVPSERGRMLGPVSMALNLGACVGPVVSGFVAYKSRSYEWVFWALVIVGAVLLFNVAAFLPETARNIVGNGSIRKESLSDQSWWVVGKRWWERRNISAQGEGLPRTNPVRNPHRKSFRIKNPFACLRIIFYFDTALILWMHGSFYVVDYVLVAAVPDIFSKTYHFNELEIGLAYLPRGIGIILGGWFNGKAMDYNYQIIAKRIGWTVNKISGDDLQHFPIEHARSRGSIWLLVISTATQIGYGWAVSKPTHVSIPLVLQFIQGFWQTCFYTIYNTLLVDIFPSSPSTAAAAASIVRCSMAAAGVALLQPVLDSVGRGWFFTVLGLWSGSCGVIAVWLIRKKGMDWRNTRVTDSTSN